VKKNLILIILFIFLSSCGYTALYKGGSIQDLRIVIINMEGDMGINNLIRTKLKPYSEKESLNIYKVNINSEYNKLILSKDSTGKAIDLQLSLKTNFTVNYNNKTKIFILEEQINIKNESNSFEQKKYENVIRNNFASSIKEKLILKLVTIPSID